MHGAIVRGDKGEVQKLITEDPSVLSGSFLGDSWLHRAAMMGKREIMEILVDAGLPVDHLTDDKIDTPLDSAAGQGHYEACAWLLDRGADPNHGIGEKATPLFSAIFSKSLNLVRLFAERGANLDATFGDPKIDVISYAESYGTPEIVAYLRETKETE